MQLYQHPCPSVCLSVWHAFWQCFNHRIIMPFSRIITIDISNVHAEGQGPRGQNIFCPNLSISDNFSRSSVKFQDHTDHKLANLAPVSAFPYHYDDVIMGAIVSLISSLTIVYSTVYSDANQRKHQSSLAFVWWIHRGPGTGEFPAQMASNAENASIWWRHHAKSPVSIRRWLWIAEKSIGDVPNC